MSEHFYLLEGKKDFLSKLIGNKPSSVIIDRSYLQIFIGKNKEEIYIPEIKEIQLYLQGNPQPANFKLFKIDLPLRPYEYLNIITKENKTFTLHCKHFEKAAFEEFLKNFQAVYIQLTETFEEKLDKVHKKCEYFLLRDRQLENEFKESMGEAYKSAYEPYVLDKKRKDVEEVLKSPSIVFYHLTNHNYYYYYMRNNFKAGVNKENIQIADNLINTAQRNLSIVQARMDFYKNIQNKLFQLRNEYKQKMQLKKVADKLGSLQERNMQGANNETLNFDIDVVMQLDILADNVQMVDSLEQSYVLKEHVNVFHQVFNDQESMLKDLNQMLSK